MKTNNLLYNELIIFRFCRSHSSHTFHFIYFIFSSICCKHENNVIPTKWRHFVLLDIIYALIWWTRHKYDMKQAKSVQPQLLAVCFEYTWIVSIFSNFIVSKPKKNLFQFIKTFFFRFFCSMFKVKCVKNVNAMECPDHAQWKRVGCVCQISEWSVTI